MTRKEQIQLGVVVVAFSLSGWVIYNGFFKSRVLPASAPILAVSQSGEIEAPKSVFPYGKTLDFSVLYSQRLQFTKLNPPELDKTNGVGVPVTNLLAPPLAGQ